MNIQLQLQERQLTLYRYPKQASINLQAWNAGDEYLINYLQEHFDLPSITPSSIQEKNTHLLILNDQFGALSCWFSPICQVSMMSDSFISQQATKENLKLNQCPNINFLTCLDKPTADVDVVIMQVPKSNRLLTWQLSLLRKHLKPNTPLIAVNKANQIHSSTLKLFEKYFGQTTTSLAFKKHRLIFSSIDKDLTSDAPLTQDWQVETHQITLSNHAAVYSGESLDIGSRFLLDYIPKDPSLKKIVDLGCGNGVLSVIAAKRNPQAKIISIDESFMAVESTKLNLQQNIPDANISQNTDKSAQFTPMVGNCLDGLEESDIDLILCNPPFHQQNAITDHIAWQMFYDSKDKLKDNGKLIVVGNRHLGYDIKLKKLFGAKQVKTIANNKKFIIIQASKSCA